MEKFIFFKFFTIQYRVKNAEIVEFFAQFFERVRDLILPGAYLKVFFLAKKEVIFIFCRRPKFRFIQGPPYYPMVSHNVDKFR